jgi:serine/threonine protein kinase
MAPPTLLNERYELNEVLGSGGMALVYKARDLMLERNVAVKVLREDFSQDVAFRERFRQEARAAANLGHPSIVTVHDFGLDQGHLFIVMEYVPGTDLKTQIKEKKQFSVPETLNLIIQACQGIGYAHRAGLVHCDIKPHNMLVSPDGRLKVTDFGIARALASIHPEERSEVVWGSPHYFSPEQAAGKPPSPASDVYSLGVILYEMLTGRLPFIAQDSAELARMHREDTPISPRSFNHAIPKQLEEIVLKVLSKEPAARYRTADQLGRLLSGLFESNPSLKRKVPLSHEAYKSLTRATRLQSISPEDQPGATNVAADALPLQSVPIPQMPAAPSRQAAEERFDWQTWTLGIVAFLLLLGLIPFWLYVSWVLTP